MTRTTVLIAPLALLTWAALAGLVSATFAYIALCLAVPVIALVLVERHLARNALSDAPGDEAHGDWIAIPKDFCPLHDRSNTL